MKLRTYYLLLAFSILLPAAVFCAIALKVLLNAQHDSAIERIQSSVRLSAMVIDSDTHRAEAVLRALAGSSALADGDLQRFDAEARASMPAPAPGSSCTTPRASSWSTRAARSASSCRCGPTRNRSRTCWHRQGECLRHALGLGTEEQFRDGRGAGGGAFRPALRDRPGLFAGVFHPRVCRQRDPAELARAGARRRRHRHRAQPPAGGISSAPRPSRNCWPRCRSAPAGVLRHVTRDSVEVYDVFHPHRRLGLVDRGRRAGRGNRPRGLARHRRPWRSACSSRWRRR